MTIEFIPARKAPPPPSDIPPVPVKGLLFDATSSFSPHPVIVLLGFLLLINAFTWFLFWADKRRAILRQWRIPESTLLFVAFLGGSIGAYAGRKVFRHKTRKQPFSTQLHAIAVFQVFMLAGVVWMFLSGTRH